MESELGPALPGEAPQIELIDGHALAAVFRRFEREPDMIHVLLTTDADSAICHVAGAVTDRMQAALPAAIQTCGSELDARGRHRSRAGPGGGADGRGTSGGCGIRRQLVEGLGRILPRRRDLRGRRHGDIGIQARDPASRTEPITKSATAALEDVDLAAEQSAKPKQFGRWSQSGDSYVLTGADGKANSYALQDGAFFKAYPAEQPAMLSTRYKRISGGGNTAWAAR